MFGKFNILKVLFGSIILTMLLYNSLLGQNTTPFQGNRNVFSIHLNDFLYSDLLLSYEHKKQGQNYGLYFPLAYNYGSVENLSGLNNTFYMGFGIHYYLPSHEPLFFHVGPEIHAGVASVEYIDVPPDEKFENAKVAKESFFFTRLFLNGGFRYSPATNMSILTKIGVGVQYADYPNVPYVSRRSDGVVIRNYNYYQNKIITPVLNFTIGIGYSF